MKNNNVMNNSSEKSLGRDINLIRRNAKITFSNEEFYLIEGKSYVGEVVKLRITDAAYKDGNEYRQVQVVFKTINTDFEGEAIYTFDLDIKINFNGRLKNLLINTVGQIPIGNNINLEELLLGKKASIKVKNYCNAKGITTSYVVEISKAN